MNLLILPAELKSGNQSTIDEFHQSQKTIGLLDIFGFENFELNQFEQICINFVNEKLHNLYISSVFGAEKEEMKRQQLDVKLTLPPMKVKLVLRLLDNMDAKKGPFGIFNTTDDKSTAKMGEVPYDKQVEKLYQAFLESYEKKNPVLDASGKPIFKSENAKKRGASCFHISHSAKSVRYDCKNFIERNADKISASLESVLKNKTGSKIGLIYSMKTGFEVEEEEDPKKRGPAPLKTIWAKFKVQIENLMRELAEPLIPSDLGDEEPSKPDPKKKAAEPPCEMTDLHFIRCLKPNEKKKPDIFFHAMTLQQITYMGVLESIRVKQENFPYRYKYEDFYRTYELLSDEYVKGRYDLMDDATKAGKDWKSLSEQIIKTVFKPLNPDEYSKYLAFGLTKLMMHSECKLVIEDSKMIASKKYDKMARFVKRSYALAKANNTLSSKFMLIVRM